MELPATGSLLLLMAAVALAKFLRPAALQSWSIVASGSLQEIQEDGYWWSVVTPVMVHSDLRHFLYNAFFLCSYARPLERTLGPAPLVALFFASHIAGFLLNLLIKRIQEPEMYRFIGGCGCSR
jgi:membrane associated rhomboid family serine protease